MEAPRLPPKSDLGASHVTWNYFALSRIVIRSAEERKPRCGRQAREELRLDAAPPALLREGIAFRIYLDAKKVQTALRNGKRTGSNLDLRSVR